MEKAIAWERYPVYFEKRKQIGSPCRCSNSFAVYGQRCALSPLKTSASGGRWESRTWENVVEMSAWGVTQRNRKGVMLLTWHGILGHTIFRPPDCYEDTRTLLVQEGL